MERESDLKFHFVLINLNEFRVFLAITIPFLTAYRVALAKMGRLFLVEGPCARAAAGPRGRPPARPRRVQSNELRPPLCVARGCSGGGDRAHGTCCAAARLSECVRRAMHRPLTILLSASCLTAASSAASPAPAGAMNVFFIAVDGRNARLLSPPSSWCCRSRSTDCASAAPQTSEHSLAGRSRLLRF